MRFPVVVATVVVLVAGCSSGPGDPAVFHREFDAVVESLPPLSSLSSGDPDELCSGVLGKLRTARAELASAPSETIAEASQQWFDVAENAFFECPPDGGDIASFTEAYEVLEAIADEIDTLRQTS